MEELDEEKYKKIKKELNKENDYFTKEELEKYGIIFDVILT